MNINSEIKEALWNKETMAILLVVAISFIGVAIFYAHHHYLQMREQYIEDMRVNYWSLHTEYGNISEVAADIMERYNITEEDISPEYNDPLKEFIEGQGVPQ